jgi:effector-binding domain-containing protein
MAKKNYGIADAMRSEVKTEEPIRVAEPVSVNVVVEKEAKKRGRPRKVTDPKDAAKKMLGEKKASDGYTPESYKKYEAAYAKILAWIEAHPKPAALTQERIDNLKNQAEAKLKEVEDADPDLNDDEEEVAGDKSQSLDEAKAKAKETLGEKKAADAYTEESYATYSENYDKILAAIEGAESVEALEALNIAENKTKNEELLVEKTTEEEPSGTDVDSEEEEVDTEIGTEDEESTGEEKISEISDDRLIKLYQVLSGRQISSNAGVAKSQLKRLRQKLASLGESIDNNSSDEELLEVLQSEAEAVKSLKDTAASLKSTANSMQNMTSAMKESILNLSPADFAECVDSSRVELWGLEESEDGVAHAVLIQTYDDVPSEDVQTCHDKMLELDGMFTFCFTASGKPSLYGWNVEQLRELNQAGFKGISFDNPAYEEALSLAWHIK